VTFFWLGQSNFMVIIFFVYLFPMKMTGLLEDNTLILYIMLRRHVFLGFYTSV
jgi:hypothetical protein